MLHLWIGIIRIILANVPAAARGLEDLGGRGDVRVPSVRAVNVDRRDIRECRDRKEKEVQPVRRENKVFREDRDLPVLKALLAHRVFPARQALRGYKGLPGQQDRLAIPDRREFLARQALKGYKDLPGQQDQQGIPDCREFLAQPVQWEIQARRVLKAIQGLSVYPAQRVLRGYKDLPGQQDQQGIPDRREFLAQPVQWEIQARRVLKAIQGLSVYPAQRVLPVLRVFRDRWAILE